MAVIIRQELPTDHLQVKELIRAAFEKEPYSDQSEYRLVDRLRLSEAFIPELSLVALLEEKIVGHILLTKVSIKSNSQSVDSLALAPVSVMPPYQGKGIGAKLIQAAHNKARDLGYKSVVLIGHEQYYPRFGYELASKYAIIFPFDAPDVNCMVKPLIDNALQGVTGKVVYPEAFFQE